MSDLNTLKATSKEIAKKLDINHHNFLAAIELIEKDKIAKPAKRFRDSMNRFNDKQRYDFVYVEMSQRSYFLMNDVFPMGEELDDEIEKIKDELNKVDDDQEEEKEFLETTLFFLEELEELNEKGFATGTIKFSKTVESQDANGKPITEHLMALRTTDLEVDGTIRKDTLVEDLRKDLKYVPTTKSGNIIYIEGENPDENTADEEASDKQKIKQQKKQNRVSRDEATALAKRNEKIEKRLIRLKDRYNKINPIQEAYKGLGLLYQMEKLSAYLNPFPEDTEEDPLSDDMKEVIAILTNLTKDRETLDTTLSEQIEFVFEQDMADLDDKVSVDSEQLEQIFGTVIKMHTGWRKFLNKPDDIKHLYGDQIERIDAEIDLIAQYEDKIAPLVEKYYNTDLIGRKSKLGKRINKFVGEVTGLMLQDSL